MALEAETTRVARPHARHETAQAAPLRAAQAGPGAWWLRRTLRDGLILFAGLAGLVYAALGIGGVLNVYQGEIAFVSDRDNSFGYNIFLADARGGAVVNLTKQHGIWNTSPLWSPDGEQIAFLSDRDGGQQLYLMDADGGNARRITGDLGYVDKPVWSPDGRYLAFVASQDNGGRAIFLYHVASSIVRPLVQLGPASYGDDDPTWSPDGARLAFVSSAAGGRGVHVLDLASGALRRITGGISFESAPRWSPDGERIAFTRTNTLYLTDASGSSGLLPIPIASSTFGGSLEYTWSPGGDLLLLAQTIPYGRGGQRRDLYVVGADGRQLRVLTEAVPGVMDANAPDWASDSARIVFNTSGRDGSQELYVFELESIMLRRLTFDHAQDFAPAWRPQPAASPAPAMNPS